MRAVVMRVCLYSYNVLMLVAPVSRVQHVRIPDRPRSRSVAAETDRAAGQPSEDSATETEGMRQDDRAQYERENSLNSLNSRLSSASSVLPTPTKKYIAL